MCALNKFRQKLSLDDETFKKGAEGDQSTFLTAPTSPGLALLCRVQHGAAAGPGEEEEEELGPAELSCTGPSQTQPCAPCWQQTGSFKRGSRTKRTAAAKQKPRGTA